MPASRPAFAAASQTERPPLDRLPAFHRRSHCPSVCAKKVQNNVAEMNFGSVPSTTIQKPSCLWRLFVAVVCATVSVCGHCLWPLSVATVCHCLWLLFVAAIWWPLFVAAVVATDLGCLLESTLDARLAFTLNPKPLQRRPATRS